MSVKNILTDIEDMNYRADEIDIKKKNQLMRDTILDLKDTIRNDDTLRSLSAPQIGVNARIICIKFGKDLKTFINPVIYSTKGLELSRENCHSIPDKTFIRPRNNDINVTYLTPLGKIESCNLVGLAAIVMQHAVDHLDGLFLSDVGLEIDSDFDNASEEERKEVIDFYLDSLDMKKSTLDKEIEEDDELKAIKNATDVLTSIAKGDIIIENEESEEINK